MPWDSKWQVAREYLRETSADEWPHCGCYELLARASSKGYYHLRQLLRVVCWRRIGEERERVVRECNRLLLRIKNLEYFLAHKNLLV